MINLARAIFTVLSSRGNCPVEAANKVIVTAIEINFDRPIGFAEPQPSPQSGTVASQIHRVFGRIFLGFWEGKVS